MFGTTMRSPTFPLNAQAMTPEEFKFFSRSKRFESYPGFDGDRIGKHSEEDQSDDETGCSRMDESPYWELSRGEKLRSLSTSKKCEENYLRMLLENNPASSRVAEYRELLRLYDELRKMVVEEAFPGWDWKRGLWDQLEVWKKIKKLKHIQDQDDDN